MRSKMWCCAKKAFSDEMMASLLVSEKRKKTSSFSTCTNQQVIPVLPQLVSFSKSDVPFRSRFGIIVTRVMSSPNAVDEHNSQRVKFQLNCVLGKLISYYTHLSPLINIMKLCKLNRFSIRSAAGLLMIKQQPTHSSTDCWPFSFVPASRIIWI